MLILLIFIRTTRFTIATRTTLLSLFSSFSSEYIILVLIIWSIYPLIWYADEVDLIKKEITTILYAMIDVIEKVGVVNLLIM
jgi:bacteriorhodopsin